MFLHAAKNRTIDCFSFCSCGEAYRQEQAAAAASQPPLHSRPPPLPPLRRCLRPRRPPPPLSSPSGLHLPHHHPLTSARHPSPAASLRRHPAPPAAPSPPTPTAPLSSAPHQPRSRTPAASPPRLPRRRVRRLLFLLIPRHYSPRSPQNPRPSRVLPSEIGLLRRELDSWGARGPHLPGSYSYAVVRVAAAFRFGVTPRWEAELRRRMLASSPKYGVRIDAAVRDHVWVLVWLCLKAAATEAQCSLDGMGKGDDHVGLDFDPRAVRFESPRLAEGISWLGAQLGILYGESNGRLFAIAAVKEAVLCMGYCLMVGAVKDGFSGGGNGQAGSGGGAGEKGSDAADIVAGPAFLSQIAAAIAALYERFTMQEKIKALQAPHPSKYQLLFEYSKALERGHLERSNRPHYRAVMEYDGILSRRVDNQESGKAKTKEELLAEERDYKRRRQSYRGKKVKRNPTEASPKFGSDVCFYLLKILRDIIDEHMEEIKQAGGIGCLVAAPEDIAQNMLKSNSYGGPYQGSFDPTSSSSHDKAALGSRSPSCENSQHDDSLGRVSSRSHGKRDSYKILRYETHGNRYRNLSVHENRWAKGPENKIYQAYPDRRESKRHQRNSNDEREYAYTHKEDVSEDSDYQLESSDCTARSSRSQRSSVTEYHHTLGEGCSDRSRTSQKRHRSVSVTQGQFNDRYDPQSTYSDEDSPTSLLYDIAEGKTCMKKV
ncbi:hypothetical protein PR202_ga30159 [Eleusine coracana subsp. coracana]|uniref:Uncharacterized protein n=1 Tax=Eleusine coracana subsp. coracana TaxID=191504 RepID=A0AAV5DNY8_ELECO|nr:hypothetical protein PR202_ga30159 [Eleusine coracana subsp. coracana]